ncbi:GNAT family N-acetyltransferase [Sphingomonas sp.]|uniref:GNAT family N-acetyltransferase n=1 Tax=Sphingomonas sp. TaxID=28214 RepID=UPI0025F5888A|nr:GNAT family N-acetyltransferase [Sphingomonas sp.]MBV9528030.1 GNAT family N-acetyltransferase [Sphingomonas sp.]
MSCDELAAGQLAAVVTYLEMRQRPDVTAPPSPLSLRPMANPTSAEYRDLFRRVGAPWLWFSRLIMDDSKLQAIIGDPRVELFAVVDGDGRDAGMLELDFREPGACELAFVGLVPSMSGQGHGRWLLAEAVHRAWRDGIERVHVHTCSLDHPAALAAYRRAGFTPYKRAVERFPDPRLLGVLPAGCAPQIPLLGTVG